MRGNWLMKRLAYQSAKIMAAVMPAKISLDCTNPDAAVFVCQNMQQGPGGMQPGYPQQGYPQQGYPPQGGYPQQGGYR